MRHLINTLLLLLCGLQLLAQEAPKTDSLLTNPASETCSSFLVFFPTGSATVADNYQTDLERLANQIASQEEKVQIFGYTDDVGQSAANLSLARRRAEAVKTILLRAGAPTELLETLALGEDQPQADNSTEAGRSQNRRVEISFGNGNTSNEAAPLDDSIYEDEQADDLLQSFSLPENARLIERELPAAPAKAGLDLRSLEDEIIGANGATVMVTYGYNSGESRPRGVLLQTSGANSFFEVPMEVTRQVGRLNIPIALPTNLGEGSFDIVARLVNDAGEFSPFDTLSVRMERLGTGKLQISLSWDTDTDQDLYLLTPSGDLINYQTPESSGGGELDRDDVDGFGPENIFWLDRAPNGEYAISVNDYSESPQLSNFVVTINGAGVNRQFFGSTQRGSTAQVCRFRKTEDGIEWLD
ncbi:MAG: OmpA family protein [Bacteroidota bacterium]